MGISKGRLARFRHQSADDHPMTAGIFQSLGQEDRNRITIVCGIALALGIHRFSIEDGLWSEFSPSDGDDVDHVHVKAIRSRIILQDSFGDQ